MQDFRIFTGSAHREFSQKVARVLDIELSQAEVTMLLKVKEEYQGGK